MPDTIHRAWRPAPVLGFSVTPGTLSFTDYVKTRRYDFGRGTRAAWQFIAFARGDAAFPEPGGWRDIEDYLRRLGSDEYLIQGARSVWRSYTARRSRARKAPEAWPERVS